MTPELTYGDIALCMVLVMIAPIILTYLVAVVVIYIDKLMPKIQEHMNRWIRRRFGPPRDVLIASNRRLHENNRYLTQENQLLLAENNRLRMLIGKIK